MKFVKANIFFCKIIICLTSCIFGNVTFEMKTWEKNYVIPPDGKEIKLDLKSKNEIRPLAIRMIGPLRQARIISNRSIDVSSLERIKEQIVKPGMTDHEKVFAAWRFVNQHVRANPDSHSSGDAIQVFNAYGGGWCGMWAVSFEAVTNAIGLKSNRWEIGGHSVNTVYYDNAWHAFDLMTYNYFLAPDNKSIAGPEILSQQGWIIDRMVDNQVERDNYDYDTLWPRLARKNESGGLPVGGVYRKARHDMRISLRENESLELRWLPKNWKWYLGATKEVKDYHDALAITGKLDGLGSGTLKYQPDFSKQAFRKGLLFEENIQLKVGQKGEITPKMKQKKARLIWRMSNPYPYVSSYLHLSISRKTQADVIRVLFSADHGVSFNEVYRETKVGKRKVHLDLMPGILEHLARSRSYPEALGSYILSAGKFSYMVMIEMEAAHKIENVSLNSIKFENEIQVINRSLPFFGKGKTQLKVINNNDNDQNGKVTFIAEQDMFSNRDPVLGETITLRAKVKNRGKSSIKKLPLRFYHTYDERERKALSDEILLKDLPPGKTKTIEYKYTCDKAGELAVELVIDPKRNIDLLPSSEKKLFSIVQVREPPILALNKTFINVYPKEPEANDEIKVSVTLRNLSGYVLKKLKRNIVPNAYRCGSIASNVEVLLFKVGPGKKDQLLDRRVIDQIYPGEYDVVDLKWKGQKKIKLHDLYVLIDPKGMTGSDKVPPVHFKLKVNKRQYQKIYDEFSSFKSCFPYPSAVLKTHPKRWEVQTLVRDAKSLDFEWSLNNDFKKSVVRGEYEVKKGKVVWKPKLKRMHSKEKKFYWRFRFRNADGLKGPWLEQQYTIDHYQGVLYQLSNTSNISNEKLDNVVALNQSLNLKNKTSIDQYTTFYASFDQGFKSDMAVNSPYPIMGLGELKNGIYGRALSLAEKNHYLMYKNHDERGKKNKVTYFDRDGKLKQGVPCILAEEGSIEMWFYKEYWASQQEKEVLMYGFNPPFQYYSRYMWFDHRNKQLVFGDRSKKHNISISYNREEIALKQWHHIAGTWNSEGLKLYINGKLVGEKMKGERINYEIPHTFIIGASRSHRNTFQGKIDEFLISKVAKTSFLNFASKGQFISEAIVLPKSKKAKTLEWDFNIPDQTVFKYDVCYLEDKKYVPIGNLRNLSDKRLDLKEVRKDQIFLKGYLSTQVPTKSPEIFSWKLKYE